MGLVPIIPSHGRDVIIGLAWVNFEFRDLFGRADSCRLPHKAWIERRLRPQLPPAGAGSFWLPSHLLVRMHPKVRRDLARLGQPIAADFPLA